MKKTTLLTAALFAASFTASQAATVSVTDADANGYGDFSGLAIDFDSSLGLAADWAPDLINGQEYSVDSISVFARNATASQDWYLGVYTTGTSASDISGFQGVSTNTINLSDGNGQVTWNFSGITVVADNVAGGGSGQLFFVLQTGTTAITTLADAIGVGLGDGVSNDNGIRRIDAEDGSYTDELAGILHNDPSFLKTTRAPEYEASITLIPEPSSAALLGLGGLALILRRRK